MKAPPAAANPGGKGTREKVLAAALTLFRKKGYAGASMRDIAAEAGVALGATYYYFPSKESIVLAYYEEQQRAHQELLAPVLATETDLRTRVAAVIQTRLELAQKDHKLIGALFHTAADPDSPVSIFAPQTASLRRASLALFEEALSPHVPAESLALAAQAFWALMMGLLLYLAHDTSKGAKRTARLATSAIDLGMSALALLSSPFGAPLRAQVERALSEAGLLAVDATHRS